MTYVLLTLAVFLVALATWLYQREKKQFVIGPLQEQWLTELETHPERQIAGVLGRRNIEHPEDAKMCCLGQGAVICGVAKWVKSTMYCREYTTKHCPANGFTAFGCGACCKCQSSNEELLFNTNDTSILNDYDLLGLRDERGELKNIIAVNGREYYSLASMNDGGLTWPQIAQEIRKNPTNFFTKSV